MMAVEISTAMIMMGTISVSPMAVITESSEKTTLSSMICTITVRDDRLVAARRGVLVVFRLVAFELVVDLVDALADQEEPADEQHDALAGHDVAEEVEHVKFLQRLHERDEEQQQDARDEREQQPEAPAARAARDSGSRPPGSR